MPRRGNHSWQSVFVLFYAQKRFFFAPRVLELATKNSKRVFSSQTAITRFARHCAEVLEQLEIGMGIRVAFYVHCPKHFES